MIMSGRHCVSLALVLTMVLIIHVMGVRSLGRCGCRSRTSLGRCPSLGCCSSLGCRHSWNSCHVGQAHELPILGNGQFVRGAALRKKHCRVLISTKQTMFVGKRFDDKNIHTIFQAAVSNYQNVHMLIILIIMVMVDGSGGVGGGGGGIQQEQGSYAKHYPER